ncbi:hypothetical protein GJV85_02365 [Sulfurimonas aquatica]|uniref:Uncharacterized protein n=1 Tax=Sulfurimonas aquatica TaxID=2672570 RepID=A0A975GC83_9BACT|nr:hypothetical protein [Sulfurimonas aquatica]QSZ41004.1 hypothetical protein GJV85_02365 [Sulfurimonas aquatica]
MSEPRLVAAPIHIYFSEAETDLLTYEREYQQLSETDDDPISQWLKLAKARGDTRETDQVLLQLVVELHRKVDALEMFIKDEKPSRVSLTNEMQINSIGFEYFNLEEPSLDVGKIYYGRIEMPVYPKHDVGVFFEALSPTLAKFTKMHERDEKEWAAYMTARERILIREAREKK